MAVVVVAAAPARADAAPALAPQVLEQVRGPEPARVLARAVAPRRSHLSKVKNQHLRRFYERRRSNLFVSPARP
ncbi:MAG TPA: hypothetical protein VES20_05645, partial [Bryobacteraceae bacterium]|nr:hypothetical protein [Bryobacteraceae bacterium]